ncbi:MAG: c-type cytochrome [Bdellovibrionales bacterium]
MKKTLLIVFSLVLLPLVSQGADIAAGKAKAVTCTACHGPKGISQNPMWPNLAGQHAQYLVKQLKAFKSGARKDPSMAPMVAPLSPADMENIAAYFSSLK